MNRASRDHFPLPLSPGGRWLPKSTPPAHSWNQVRAVALQSPLQVVTRRAVTSLKPGSCVSFHTRRNQVSVTLHTQTPPPAITGPGPGPCVPPCCPSAGTSVRLLVPLARGLGAWLVLPGPSRWLLRTIRLGYAIQFARHPPKFRGVHFSESCRCPCPVCGNRSPAGEGCDRTGPSSRYEVRVLQHLLHCAQEKRWVTTDLGSASFEPCTSQAAVQNVDAETHFWVRPSPRLVCSDRPEGRVLSCLDPPATQAIPEIRVRGSGISVQGPALWAVPVALCLHQSRGGGPCSFERTGCAHPQLPRRLAQTCTVSRAVVRTQGPGAQAPQPVGPSGQLGKSKLVPTQRISFLGMELDSVNQTARLTQERAQSVLNCLKTLSGRTAVPLKLFQRLLGHMAAAAAIVPLGLLHMRPLQHWLHGRIPRWAWKRGTHRVQIAPACRKTFSLWSDPSFLRAGVPLEQVSRYAVVFTDASATGWGATYNGHAVLGVWTGPQLCWHINCLELLAVRLALSRLRGRLQGKDVLVRTDNTATVAYINRQGGLRSRCMSQLAPPPPPLESEASEVPSCHPHPRSAQPGSRRAVSSSTTRGVATPSSGGPADLESVRS